MWQDTEFFSNKLMLIDTHIHLSDEKYTDINSVVKLAIQNSIKNIITIGCSVQEINKNKKLVSQFENVYSSVGAYPLDNQNENLHLNLDELLENIKKEAVNSKVVAIGECGLDFSESLPTWEVMRTRAEQEKLFCAQIEIARNLNLPVIVHSRNAKDLTLQILASEMKNKEFKFVWHCFTENFDVAKSILDLGGLISFTGIVTYKTGIHLEKVIRDVPLEKMMLETDGPYLVPEPIRSRGVKINRPEYVKIIAEKISDIKGISSAQVASQTTLNANNFFSLKTND